VESARPSVVVTGSTRGIGRALAAAFHEHGCNVVISGRDAGAVASVTDELAKRGAPASVIGHACDVADYASVQALWDACIATFGSVDVWINNAGTCNPQRAFAELGAEQIRAVVTTNVVGTMNGSHVALRGMQKQGHGRLFNMEGWGSRGEWLPGMTLYSSTKIALRYFTDALVREARGSPIVVGTLSPGMVVTDLLIDTYVHGAPENWRRSRWLFKFVIDPPEPVCEWLARRVLGSRRSGAHYAWMTPWRLLPRFFLPKYHRRNPVLGTPLDTLGR
jgi:NAD(P)-dependent dehydrogenase (short-subunit alcohol dehydrogenase family)